MNAGAVSVNKVCGVHDVALVIVCCACNFFAVSHTTSKSSSMPRSLHLRAVAAVFPLNLPV